tara:strand:- start:307 stop:540 length:234 start_codon:yes stop_codon:yes gene_type:complete
MGNYISSDNLSLYEPLIDKPKKQVIFREGDIESGAGALPKSILSPKVYRSASQEFFRYEPVRKPVGIIQNIKYFLCL